RLPAHLRRAREGQPRQSRGRVSADSQARCRDVGDSRRGGAREGPRRRVGALERDPSRGREPEAAGATRGQCLRTRSCRLRRAPRGGCMTVAAETNDAVTGALKLLLRSFRLKGFEENYALIADHANTESLSYESFLYELSKVEAEERRNRKIERRLKESRL